MVQKNKSKQKKQQQPKSIKGKGAYFNSPFKNAPGATDPGYQPSTGRKLLTGAAAGVGSAFGGPLGGFLGGALGHFASNIFGLGKYKMRNSLVNMGSQVPTMHSSNQSIVVRHSEYVCDIVSSASVGAFSVQSFPINPAQASTFTWLSGIASNFQEWTPRGVAFFYKTQSGNSVSSNNTTLADVIMSTQYRASSAAFTNQDDMLQQDFASSSVASESFMHYIECDPRENPYNVLYTRPGATPALDSINMFDLGSFSIATIGCQAASVTLGKLFVTYEIELRKPYNGIPRGLAVNNSFLKLTAATTAAPFGTALVAGSYNPLGLTVNTPTGTVLTIPANTIEGSFAISVWYPSVTASVITAFTQSSNLNFLSNLWNGTNTQGVTSTANGSGCSLTGVYTVINPQLASTFTPNFTLTGATSCYISFYQINPAAAIALG